MPKRVEDATPVEETTQAPAKATRTPKAETPAEEAKTVKKLPLTEKCKKYLADINPAFVDSIHEIVERVVEDEEKNKNNVCFVTFSDDVENDEINHEVNVAIIKDVLFAYHTIPEKKPSGKAMEIEILPEDELFILVMQEI